MPVVFRSPGFALFWIGLALSSTGMRASAAANIWQVQDLTGSTFAVGLVALFEAIAVIGLAPLGGGIVDRLDRRVVLQAAQATSMAASLLLAGLTFSNLIAPVWIYVASALVAAAAAFDNPSRQSLVPALVPREQLIDAYSVLVPAMQLARLVGPALAGVLIAIWGVGAVYVLDATTYLILILTLTRIPFTSTVSVAATSLRSGLMEGLSYVKKHAVLRQLIALDVVANLFAGYRVLLPTLAQDVLAVGPTGYGLLSAAPAFGAIVGAGLVYRLRALRRKGLLVIAATLGYGLFTIVLGGTVAFAVAIVCVAAIGLFDSMGVSVRQAVLQGEAPDALRGRVTSAHFIFSRGGTSLGQAQLGAMAGVVGTPAALAIGGILTVGSALWLAARDNAVRRYEG